MHAGQIDGAETRDSCESIARGFDPGKAGGKADRTNKTTIGQLAPVSDS